jgi:hypothetical protein
MIRRCGNVVESEGGLWLETKLLLRVECSPISDFDLGRCFGYRGDADRDILEGGSGLNRCCLEYKVTSVHEVL